MTSFEYAVEIDRPVEEVWAFVADAANNPVWQIPIVEVPRGTGELRVGSRITEVAQFLGRRFELGLVVTEFQPPYRSVVRAEPGPVRLSGTYRLEALPTGTRFTLAGDFEGHGFFRLAEPVFARIARRTVVTSADTLKDVLEAASVRAS
jgi:uncharacterized protein YndB with AHSA1/START domain